MHNAMIFDLTFVGRYVLSNAFSRIRHFRIFLNTSDEVATEDISKINAQKCTDIYHSIFKTTLDNHTPLKSKSYIR